jgi:translocation and assembly module TamB
MRHRVFISAGILAILLGAVVGIGVWTVRSGWLIEKIRLSLAEQAEKATGGKMELGALRLDWRTLTVEIDRFVIHGTEPAGQAPLLAIDRVKVWLRVVSLLQRDVGIERIEADRPRAHLIVHTDGNTNLPQPKITRKPVAETILDLKIAQFDLRDGAILEESEGRPAQMVPLSAHGENLTAHVLYDLARARYSGDISLQPLHLAWNGLAPVDVWISAGAAMERNRIVLSTAHVTTAESAVDLKNAVLNNFHAPEIAAQYDATISLAEVEKIFKLDIRQAGTVMAAGEAHFVSRTDYRVTGEAHGSGIAFDILRNVAFAGNFDAGPEKVLVNAARVNALGGQITASGEIRGFDEFHANGRLEHFDGREVAALVTAHRLPYDGLISGPFEASGRLRDLRHESISVGAHLSIAPAGPSAVHGDVAVHYDAVRGDIAVHYDAAARRIELGRSWLELPHTRVDVAGTFGERLGARLDLKLESQDAADLIPLFDTASGGKPLAVTYKSLSFLGTVSGALTNPQIAGHAAVEDVQYRGQQIESMAGDFTASGTNISVRNGAIVSNGIHGRADGSLGLTDWTPGAASPVVAHVTIANADLTKILALAGHKEIEISGNLTATAQIGGTLGGPLGEADLTLSKGYIYAQPFDSITGRAQSTGNSAQSITGLFISGPKRVNISARFDHAGTQFPAGLLELNLTSNTMPLNQIALVRQRQPDIHGFGEFHTTGTLRISHDAKHQIQFDLLDLTADASANGIELEGRNLGDAHFTAQTKNGFVTARFDSNAAKAVIHGEGTMELAGDYPVNGKLTFSDAGLNALAALIVKEEDARNLNFDGSAQGDVTLAGPARDPARLTATMNIARVEVKPLPGTELARTLPNFALTNDGPVRMALTTSSMRIESARFKAPQTDLTIDGTMAFTQRAPLDFRVRGEVNLALAGTINPDLTSSGALTLNATVRGGWRTPDFSGSAALHNGNFHYAQFSNGLTNANGTIVFNGSRANIESFTAESGGGKVDAGGFAAIANGLLAFRIETRTHGVRVRYPEGVSSISDAALTFAGTSQRSEASGVITVHRVAINPRADAATILAATVSPVQTSAPKSGLIANVNLDIQVETAPDVEFETSVAQSIQADANLRVRGTATNPALLGRINITQGDLLFFGNKYSINQGSISFFNPARIDPILNIDLETRARGVDVILTVSGPLNKLNVNYRSDPPLQFSDIVALLATGRSPTDPSLGWGVTGPSTGFQDLGASALLDAAIANPSSDRLQRFFGVSRIKIDPQLTGVTGSPEARLTVEQQVTPELLFTYISDVSSTSTQLFRVEWSFNRQWSAILIREENGYVGLDFAFKKRFK